MFAEGHQQEDFVDAVRAERDAGVNVTDNVLVAGQIALQWRCFMFYEFLMSLFLSH